MLIPSFLPHHLKVRLPLKNERIFCHFQVHTKDTRKGAAVFPQCCQAFKDVIQIEFLLHSGESLKSTQHIIGYMLDIDVLETLA